MTPPPAPAATNDTVGLRRTIAFAVLAGLCPLIPLPFIDDIALDLVRKQLVTSLFGSHKLALSPALMAALLQSDKPNALIGCFASIVLYPIKKLFRKIFFVLAIKDSVDAASAVLHEGMLIRHALSSGLVDQRSLADGTASMAALNAAIRATCKQTDTRPVNQTLRRVFTASRSALSAVATTLASAIRSKGGTRNNPESVGQAFEAVEQGSDPQVERMVDEIGEQMFAEPGYLESLKKRFDDNFRKASSAHVSAG